MDIESKVGDIRDMLHELKPVIHASAKAIESIDLRTRALEIKDKEHDVKIDRLGLDMDGLGRKVRVTGERLVMERPSKLGLVEIVEAMIALPKFWHIAVIGFVALVGAADFVIKHWPH